VPLDPAFEHGLVVLSGQVALPDLAPMRPALPGDARSGAGVASRGAAGPTVVGPTVIGPAVIGPDRLVVAPAGRSSLTLSTDRPTRALLLGGTPWKGPLVMWWNFVGATAAEVEAARDDWQAGRRFGATAYAEVPGVGVPRIPAPPLLPGRLISRT
jgi:hypothetical protein